MGIDVFKEVQQMKIKLSLITQWVYNSCSLYKFSKEYTVLKCNGISIKKILS